MANSSSRDHRGDRRGYHQTLRRLETGEFRDTLNPVGTPGREQAVEARSREHGDFSTEAEAPP